MFTLELGWVFESRFNFIWANEMLKLLISISQLKRHSNGPAISSSDDVLLPDHALGCILDSNSIISYDKFRCRLSYNQCDCGVLGQYNDKAWSSFRCFHLWNFTSEDQKQVQEDNKAIVDVGQFKTEQFRCNLNMLYRTIQAIYLIRNSQIGTNNKLDDEVLKIVKGIS